MTIHHDPNDPLKKTSAESTKSNVALVDYALMGKARSLKKLIDAYKERASEGDSPPTVHLSTVERWSKQHNWQVRLADYEANINRERLARREQRQQEWEEKSWELAQKLIARAELMLKHPLTKAETNDGKTIIIPVKWKLETAGKFVETADKLARLSTKTETHHHQVNFELTGNLPEGLTMEKVDEYIDEIAASILMETEQDNN